MTALNGDFDWLRSPGDEGARPHVLGWDGRIDNRDDMLGQLRDVVRGDSSCGALMAAAYQRWGIAGLGRVIGDWSVVIRDAASDTIVLASDFAGIRPLYYHHQAGKLHWSARLEWLVEETGVDTIDEVYVGGFLMFGRCPNRTPYSGILSVPPGHAVCVSSARVTVHPFWAMPTSDVIRYADERRYDEQFCALFREAVAVRLQTDAPVVAELSGGLDSSSVVCLANHLIRSGAVPAKKLTSISYVHRDSLDAPFIREVESHCGIEGIHLSTHETPLASEADADDPMPGDSAPLERSAAMAARRLGAKVFLTGQNGDLVMGNWFDDSLQVAASLRRGRIRQASEEALAWSKVLRIPVLWILSRAAQALMPGALASSAVYSIEGLPAPEKTETSLRNDFLTRTGIAASKRLFSDEWMHAPPERRRHFRALTVMRELRTLQAFGAMEGLDYTHPFAHRPLVEFLMSVPADVLCRPGEPRRLMRRALADFWPPKLRTRRSKSLFGAPQFEALKPLAARLLAERRWHVVDRGWIDKAGFAARLEKLTNGIDGNAPQLRQIILLEYWLRHQSESGPSEVALMAG